MREWDYDSAVLAVREVLLATKLAVSVDLEPEEATEIAQAIVERLEQDK